MRHLYQSGFGAALEQGFKALPFSGLPIPFCTAAITLLIIYNISVCSFSGKGSWNPKPNLEPHIARGCKNLKWKAAFFPLSLSALLFSTVNMINVISGKWMEAGTLSHLLNCSAGHWTKSFYSSLLLIRNPCCFFAYFWKLFMIWHTWPKAVSRLRPCSLPLLLSCSSRAVPVHGDCTHLHQPVQLGTCCLWAAHVHKVLHGK